MLEKGSQEAKDYMKALREKRGQGIPKISRPSVGPPPEGRPIMKINRPPVKFKRPPPTPTEGEGIIQDAVEQIKKVGKKAGEYVGAVVSGRGDEYPPKVRRLLKKYGAMNVTSAEIRRAPVQSVLVSAMNVLTFGKFKKNMAKTPYDSLFHLQLVLTLDNNQKILVEKNEVINMAVMKSKISKETEVAQVSPFTSTTLNEALEKARALMGSRYFTYNAENNNCQDFIMAILKSNGWGSPSNYEFVKQDTKKLFKGLSGLAKTAYTLTEIGARANVALTGKGAEN